MKHFIMCTSLLFILFGCSDNATQSTDGKVIVDKSVTTTSSSDTGIIDTLIIDASNLDTSLSDKGILDVQHPYSDANSSSTGQPSIGQIECGASFCSVASDICCSTKPDGGNTSYGCLPSSSTCTGTTIACDEPGDCETGNVCCRPDGTSSSVCMLEADCSDSKAKHRCHLNSDCPETIPICCPSQSMTGGTCKTQCSSGSRDGGKIPREAGINFYDQGISLDKNVIPDKGNSADLKSISDGGSSTGQPSIGQIECGASFCSVASDICCSTKPDGGNTSYGCLPSSSTCTGTTIACDEPGDCETGNVCCRPDGTSSSVCMLEADCSDSKAKHRCHLNSDCPESLPICCPSQSMTGGTCKTQC